LGASVSAGLQEREVTNGFFVCAALRDHLGDVKAAGAAVAAGAALFLHGAERVGALVDELFEGAIRDAFAETNNHVGLVILNFTFKIAGVKRMIGK
jgi:hypothetical protein